jgi:hypothetical protein
MSGVAFTADALVGVSAVDFENRLSLRCVRTVNRTVYGDGCTVLVRKPYVEECSTERYGFHPYTVPHNICT